MTSAPGTPERVKILVVDDHPENIFALRECLARADYEIVEARSGDEALTRVLKHSFAVILLDVLMPSMDGFQVAALIRQREASRDVPIIFLTASSSESQLVFRGYAVGAVDYLVKPVSPDVVRAKVSIFVELHRKELRLREQERQLRDAERQRGDAAVREGEALYQATFDRAAVGIAHTAPDGTFTRTNARFTELTRYEPLEALTVRLQDLVGPADLSVLAEGMRRVLAHQTEAWSWEGRLLQKGGATGWVALTLSAIRSTTGSARHLIAVMENVTERRLGQERQRLLAAAGESLLGSAEAQPDLQRVAELAVQAVSDFCLLEVSLSDGSPSDLAAAVRHPELRERLPPLQEWVARRDPVAPRGIFAWEEPPEDTAFGPGPGARTSSVMVVPLTLRGKVLGRLVLAAELGQRGAYRQADLFMAENLAHRIALALENTRLFRQVENAVRARDEFLAIASQSLRTPLMPLRAVFQRYLGAQAREPVERLEPAQLRSVLVRSERQVHRLITLVDKLLDVSTITAGVLTLDSQLVNLAEVVREVTARSSEELARAGCELRLRVDGAVVGLWDRLRIEQIVGNLLSNAVKHGAGRPVEVALEASACDARITVRDHGIGIEPEALHRIFGRFEQAVSPRAYGGLGLGLYIARQIAEAHGGSIEVSSQVGAGSTFVLRLPISEAAAARNPRSAEEQADLQLGA